jgi:hypothetical protein
MTDTQTLVTDSAIVFALVASAASGLAAVGFPGLAGALDPAAGMGAKGFGFLLFLASIWVLYVFISTYFKTNTTKDDQYLKSDTQWEPMVIGGGVAAALVALLVFSARGGGGY